MRGSPLTTLETVDADTPASFATSLTVTAIFISPDSLKICTIFFLVGYILHTIALHDLFYSKNKYPSRIILI
jgi:hypothetical protein